MRCRSGVVFRRWSHNRATGYFWYPIDKLLLFAGSRSRRIDDNVICVSWCFAEQVEDRSTVCGMSLAEWIAVNVDLSKIRNTGEPRQLGRVSELVISEVNTFKRKQTFHSSE
jgi:hypothetical protein